LQINDRILNDVLKRFAEAMPFWRELLDRSFLSENAKQKYSAILSQRADRMGL
jgi:hypothetical protein